MGHRKQRVVRELGLQGGADLQLLHGLGGRAAELAADGAVTDKMDGDLKVKRKKRMIARNRPDIFFRIAMGPLLLYVFRFRYSLGVNPVFFLNSLAKYLASS